MAGKKLAKTIVGIGALAVAGKVGFDKYKAVKERYTKEENESVDAEVKKYNTIFGKKIVEIEDEEFTGCEVKTVGSKTVIDLGLAVFEKDVYINFSSTASTVSIILPEGVNVACDIEKTASGIRNLINNSDEEGIHTVYIIGKAIFSNVEVIPVNFYVDDDEDFEDDDFEEDDLENDSEADSENESMNKSDQTKESKDDNNGSDSVDSKHTKSEESKEDSDKLDIEEI